MCDWCKTFKEARGENPDPALKEAIHLMKELVTWVNKSGTLLLKHMSENAGDKIFGGVSIMNQIIHCFMSRIISEDDIDFCQIALVMVNTLETNIDVIKESFKKFKNDKEAMSQFDSYITAVLQTIKGDAKESSDFRFN